MPNKLCHESIACLRLKIACRIGSDKSNHKEIVAAMNFIMALVSWACRRSEGKRLRGGHPQGFGLLRRTRGR